MNPDGTGMTKLTSNVNGDFAPAWKPDGTKLVYNCSDGTYDQLCVMNPDGTNQTALTGSTIEHDNAAWSLDGTQIAFSASIHPYDFSLDVMNADGTNVHTVTTGNFDNENITWSPDGTKFLYQGFGTGGEQVFYANTDGSGQTGITPETERAFNPDWQPLVADSDGDGIPNNTESGGPNGGDSNGDGISDQYQPQVTGLLNPLTNTYNVVQSTCTSNSSLSITSLSQAYKDAGFNYPEGLLGFTLKCPSPGTTATVTVYYYGLSDSSNLVLRKYNNTTHTYQTIPGVTISAATIGGQALTKATYQITDGGPLDQDGSANGVIVDPIGIAAPAVGAPNTGLGGTASRTNVPYWLLRDRRTTVVL
jgi:TolB protein